MAKKSKRLLTLILSLSLCTSTMGGSIARADENTSKDTPKTGMRRLEQIYQKNNGNYKGSDVFKINRLDDNEEVRAIVELKGGVAAKGNKGKNLAMAAKEKEDIVAKQESIKQKVNQITGNKIRNSYGYLINGFSTTVKRNQIDEIVKIPGVLEVTEAKKYTLDMNYAKELTQATQVWQELGTKGEGTLVAIIDSGIDVSHKDMKLTDINKAKMKDVRASNCTNKVPFGYNYADRNSDFLDRNPKTGMHGMHVAGIVAANGDDKEVKENKAIKGVAPEAQLLAMKVFANAPEIGYAFTDDIVAAIEDSVLLGADVINMSLGSPAGIIDPEDPEQKAIKNATEQGTLVVVAGGNEYFSTYPNKLSQMPDTGAAGTPGISKGALQVASYENTKLMNKGFKYSSDNEKGTKIISYVPTDTANPIDVLTLQDGYAVVDCGVGDVGDFSGKSVEGKIALIKRGGLTFVEKQQNAQAAGAVAAIVYNNDGDDSYINMKADESINIPAIFIGSSDGKMLQGLISKNLKIKFGDFSMSVDNTKKDSMSEFSSWGPSPDLDFKPEITAPGGQIWSTVNNNKYEAMSGTSMATPHTSGAEALIISAKKAQKNFNLQGKNIIDFLRNTSMNTAKILMDKEHTSVPYSPRNQGAGLIQIKDAIDNNVLVTYEGKGAAALKEIGKEKTFELKLHNYGDKQASYTLENGGILTENKTNMDELVSDGTPSNKVPYDIEINGATMSFSKNQVTVKPSEDVSINVTITLPNGFETEQFVEGYVKFNSTAKGITSLSMPYMGFCGDWGKPLIFDKPRWDKDHISKGSVLITPGMMGDLLLAGYKDKDENVIVDSEKIAMSPDTPTGVALVAPCVSNIRSAEKVVVEALDSKGNVIRKVGVEDKFRKYVGCKQKWMTETIQSGMWDGKVYDNKSGNYVAVKDGQYYMRVTSYISENDKKGQELVMPVKVDTVLPIAEIKSCDNSDTAEYDLKWNASDAYSGLDTYAFTGDVNGAPMITVNDKEIEDPIIEIENNNSFTTKLKLNKGKNTIKLRVFDAAYNMCESDKVVTVKDDTPAQLKPDVEVTNLKNLTGYNRVVDGKYTVEGNISSKVKTLIVNGENAEIDLVKGKFKADVLVVDEEANEITIIAKDIDNKELYNKKFTVLFDTKAPEIKITSPIIQATDYEGMAGKILTNSNVLKIEGNVNDKNLYKLTVNGGSIRVSKDGTFKTTLTVEGPNAITVRAMDYAGNTTTYRYVVIADIKEGDLKFDANLYDYMNLNPKYLRKENGKYYYNVYGKVSRNVKVVRIQNQDVPVSDLMFHTYVEIKEGLTKISLYIEDIDGTVVANYAYDAYLDVTPPEISLTSPCVIKMEDDANTKYEVAPDKNGNVILKGSIVDNTYGYMFYINGDAEITAKYGYPAGNESLRHFEKTIPAKAGQVINLYAIDAFGSETTRKINVVGAPKPPYIPPYTPPYTSPVVSAAYVEGITVTVDKNEVIAGGTTVIKVNAKYSDGKAVDVTDKATLTCDNGTLEKGIFKAPANYSGKVVIKAQYEGKKAEIELNVKNAPKGKRLSGANRIETSKVIAEEFNNDKVDNAIIASGFSFADALAGSTLSKKLNAPILLVGSTVVESQPAISYIKEHLNKDGKVYVLGGEGAVNESIVNSIKLSGYNNITRLSGNGRYETCKAINEQLNAEKGTPVFLVSGENFADALSISSVAAAKGYPVLLTSGNELSSATKETLQKINPSKVYIIGGTRAISDKVKEEVKTVVNISESNIERISGKDRYDTSLEIAKFFKLEGENVCFAYGNDFPDALAGTCLASKLNAHIILIDNANVKAQKNYINNTNYINKYFFGGTGIISDEVIDQLK